MKLVILSLLLVANTAIYSNESPVNGCGPAMGKLYLLAPNKVKALGIDFTSACNLHDLCYGNSIIAYVKDGNSLHRGQFKTNKEQRSYCDNSFRDDMYKQCSFLPPLNKTICHSLAKSYFSFVVIGGEKSFTSDLGEWGEVLDKTPDVIEDSSGWGE